MKKCKCCIFDYDSLNHNMTSFAASPKGKKKSALCFPSGLGRDLAFITVSCPDFAIEMCLILLSYLQRDD